MIGEHVPEAVVWAKRFAKRSFADASELLFGLPVGVSAVRVAADSSAAQ